MRRLLFAAVLAGALAAGCGSTANLDAIKKFGSLAAQAQQTSDAMAAALYQDCLTARDTVKSPPSSRRRERRAIHFRAHHVELLVELSVSVAELIVGPFIFIPIAFVYCVAFTIPSASFAQM